ncbi:MAG TPA: hypothetical protein VM146_12010 [Steroidobacteraceae bacterium]|nr:hypothetical protein [Steroidobacteraceae bacterium]
MKAALLASLVVMFAAGAVAHDLFDFDGWMSRIEDGSQDLQRHIAAKDVAAARGSARELEELYALMQQFFAERGGAADAVRMSREGYGFAKRAQDDLAAGRFASAKQNALRIAHGCRDCHFNYKPFRAK